MIRIDAITTFPAMFDSVMGSSMMKRAQEKGILDFHAFDLRDWTYDRHRTTDDDPYGGGCGLVMTCPPVFEALEAVLGLPAESLQGQPAGEALCAHAASFEEPKTLSTRVIMLSPHGRVFDDALACEFSMCERLVFVCGHYEGMDERIYTAADEIVSIGDYVLTSGELAAMVVTDAVVRKIPGVLGAQGGAEEESFACGLLEYPQYTRPASYRGMEVPDVLLSGDHGKVAQWRREQALARTRALRPDMLS